MTVAFPTSLRRRARSENTAAPSTPENTHTVMSIIATTWDIVPPRGRSSVPPSA